MSPTPATVAAPSAVGERPPTPAGAIGAPMNKIVASATITLDDAHFREHFDAWLHNVSRGRKSFRRVTWLLAVLGVSCLGLALAGIEPGRLIPLSAGAFGGACVGAVSSFLHRRRTLRGWQASAAFGQRVTFAFTPGRVVQTNAAAPHTMQKRATAYVFAAAGLLLRLRPASAPDEAAEQAMYIPYRAFTPPVSKGELVALLAPPGETAR